MHPSGEAHTVGRHMYAHSTHTHTYMWEVERGRKRSKRAGGQAKCKNGIHERRKQEGLWKTGMGK